ncbi:hypothetical protein B296_00025383, partial [Ensete ventricosum]
MGLPRVIVAARGSPVACARGRFFSRTRRRNVSPRGEKDQGDVAFRLLAWEKDQGD